MSNDSVQFKMANSKDVSDLATPNKVCKCKSKAIKGFKCVECNTILHPSCVKKCNITILSDKLVNCCENVQTSIDNMDDIMNVSFKTVTDGSSPNDREDIEVNYLHKIINMKDEIIMELRDKIDILKFTIKTMTGETSKISPSARELPKLVKANVQESIQPNTSTPVINPINENYDKNVNKQNQVNSKQKDDTAKNQKHKTCSIMSSNINNGNKDTKININPPTNVKLNLNKTSKSYNRKEIVGTNMTNTNIKTIAKLGHLHVYRMHPDTSEANLTEFLSDTAPDIPFNCVLLNKQKHTASFKVSYPLNFNDKVYDDKIWPAGAAIRRFIAPRKDFTKTTQQY